MFGQPGSPSFTKFTVKNDGIEMNSYMADMNGNATLFNTMKVKRTQPHTAPQGVENVEMPMVEGEKFLRNGQIFILKNGRVFNMLGQEVK